MTAGDVIATIDGAPPFGDDLPNADIVRRLVLLELNTELAMVRHPPQGEEPGAVLLEASQRLGQLIGAGVLGDEGYVRAALEQAAIASRDSAKVALAIRKFGLAELDVAIAAVRQAQGEDRGVVLSEASRRLGQVIGAGALNEGFAKASIEAAAGACGMIGAKASIEAAIKLGKRTPADLSGARYDAKWDAKLGSPAHPEAERDKKVIADGIELGKKNPRDLSHVRGEVPARSRAQKAAAPTPSVQPGDRGRDGKPPTPSDFDIDEINNGYSLTIWGGKAVVVNEQPLGPVNDRVRVMSFDSMNSWFGNRYTEISGADGRKRSVTWAKAWHQHPDRRQYAGVEFFPNPDGAAYTTNYMNLWCGFSVDASENGSCEKFKDHLRVNVCQEDKALFRYLFGWCAHLVQKPRDRAGVALVLRGRKGTGKTKVGEVLGSLFAPHYYLVDDARYLTGQFNQHMVSCLLLQADEAMWAGDKAAEGRLKGLITSSVQMIEAKGVDPIRAENRVHVIMTSNEDWVIPASGDERRFCVLDVGSLCERNNQYFAEIDSELDQGGRERLLHELLTFDLEEFNIWDIPKTNALLDQKIGSLSPIDEFWHSRLHDGTLIHGDDTWRIVVAREDLYTEYLREIKSRNMGRARGGADFGKRLRKLAPAIRDTRPAIEKEPGVLKRTFCYEMPSLEECRQSFEKHLGQPMKWPTLLPEDNDRPMSGGKHADDACF
jgi:hypothetical protein